MHGLNVSLGSIGSGPSFTHDKRINSNNTLSFMDESLKQLSDLANLQEKISNSKQAANYQHSLERQVNALQQQLVSSERRISELLRQNFLVPWGAIQGISGYICKNCQTFSLKWILDIGYDMTVETKHRCNETSEKRTYLLFAIPSDNPNVDDWAARCLLDHLVSHTPIGKYLIASDITDRLNKFGYKLNPGLVREFLGIPGKLYFHSFENNFRTSWINRAIDNLEKVVEISNDEALDFFRKVKSTYAIFELPIGNTVRQYFVYFTNNWESRFIKSTHIPEKI